MMHLFSSGVVIARFSVENLINNTTLCELYLPSTGLYTKEAECLGRYLQRNYSLKVLDVSNNFIGDRGLETLAKSLLSQTIPDCGLSVLVIFNNQITEKSGPIINSIIVRKDNMCFKNYVTFFYRRVVKICVP